MPLTPLTAEQLTSYSKDGYLVVRNFYASTEMYQLQALLHDQNSALHQGTVLSNAWWNDQEADVLTGFTHNENLVNSLATLLGTGSQVCHIDTKTVEKQPQTGGTWAWHQDFAHWHANHLLFADQVSSFMVALTPINKTNGCSQVIRGSHKLGRLDHGFGGDQRLPGADREMVNLALESLEIVDIELGAGDGLFFHSNLLHRGQTNESATSSWSFVASYATEANLSTNDTYAAWHFPIIPVRMDELSSIGSWRAAKLSGKDQPSVLKELASLQLLYAS